MEPALFFRGAVCLLGQFPALAGVDLSVEHGEILLLKGANGAGKTTFLRLCAGLLPLSAGEGRVLGFDLRTDALAVRDHIGLLGHATFLYDDLTVSDNVRFWSQAARVDPADAAAAMDSLGLSQRLSDVKVSALSAGQRRRCAIAILIARRPQVWLLDEPHAGLDQSGRDLLDSLIKSAAAAGATVILASHELDRAQGLAHRELTIAGGTIVADVTLIGTDELNGGPSVT